MASKDNRVKEDMSTKDSGKEEELKKDTKKSESAKEESKEESKEEDLSSEQGSGGACKEDKAEASNEDADAGESSDGEDASDNDKKSKDKKDKFKEQISELNDKLIRQMAEFENFRKRSDKEKSQMYDMGVKSTIEKILPVVDNFERGLESAVEGDSFADGMKMIYKQLMTALNDMGVKEIEAEGQEFNPDYHNAVMHIDDDELGDNVVAEVMQKGYMYNDSVVRHAMVKVAN